MYNQARENNDNRIICRFALLTIAFLPCAAQDPADWQSLAALHPGDKVRLSLRSHKPVTDTFREWNADQVTVGANVAKKGDVLKVERYREGGWSRGKTAGVGALIGLGSGVAIGAALGGCNRGDFICFSRGTVAAVLGAVFAIIGAGVGALIPHRRTDLIYSAK